MGGSSWIELERSGCEGDESYTEFSLSGSSLLLMIDGQAQAEEETEQEEVEVEVEG